MFKLFLTLLVSCCTYSASALTIGENAPTFSDVPSAHSKKLSLADYRGKWVVLEWTNKDCPFVRKHYDSGHMQKLQKTYTGKGVIWLSVISSAPGKQGHLDASGAPANLQSQKASPTDVLLDPKGALGKLYGAKTTPHLFVIDPEGKLRYQGAIDSVRSTDPEDIASAQNYISLALEAGLAGRPIETSTTQPYGCSVKY